MNREWEDRQKEKEKRRIQEGKSEDKQEGKKKP
jgi:hypothetical protein